MKISLSLSSLAALTALGLPAQAALVNLYTFNDGTTNDSVGGKNGNLVNPGNNAVLSGGKVDISANNGNNLGANAYVNLPNGLFSSAISSTTGGGVAGQASFSLWFTVAANSNWAAALSFGNSNGGEDTSSGANAADYLQLIPQNGANSFFRLTTHTANLGAEGFVDTASAAPLSSVIQAVGVFDNGNLSFYVNGVLAGTVAQSAGLNLSTFADVNNWLGRSQWGDPQFDGAYDELAIYNHALTQSEVTSAFNAGPVAVPEASGAALGLLGMAGLLTRRRRA